MAERVFAQAETATVAGCETALGEARDRNAEELFTGAGICGVIGRRDDSTFLVLAAQARAMADMELVMPDSVQTRNSDRATDLSEAPPPPFGVIDLYGFIYAYGGGAGPTEAYRDRDRTERLFARLETWEPRRPVGYNPGWEGSRSTDDETYSASIRKHVTARTEQLSRLALLYRDDAYYDLQRELEALMEANNNTFHVGTPAELRFNAIQAEQSLIAERLRLTP